MPTLTINKVRIRYEVVGTGTPVAFTPGGFGPLDEARPFAEALGRLGCQVVIYDRPNCGASDVVMDDSQSIYHLFADALHDLLAALGRLPCYVAGASAGAVTALAFAHRHPESAKGLVLISPPTDDPGMWQAVAHSTFLQPARLAEMCGMPAVTEISLGFFDFPRRIAMNPGNRDTLLAMNPGTFAAVLRRWAATCANGREHFAGLTDGQIAHLDTSALVLSGPDGKTGLHPRHTAERLHALLPDSRLIIPYEALPAREVESVRTQVAEAGGQWYDAALAPFVKEFVRGIEKRREQR